MLRTVMEMLHYPHLNFFNLTERRISKKLKKKENENKNKKHLLIRVVKLL